jgi:hypothetical protein
VNPGRPKCACYAHPCQSAKAIAGAFLSPLVIFGKSTALKVFYRQEGLRRNAERRRARSCLDSRAENL